MAERLKAPVLKTGMEQSIVGSNPSPSALTALQFDMEVCIIRVRGGARVVDWGRLLSGCRGYNLGRRFESCPPRSLLFWAVLLAGQPNPFPSPTPPPH